MGYDDSRNPSRNEIRPYMFMYTAADEVEELGVINLTLVRVDFKSHLEKMLQVSSATTTLLPFHLDREAN